MKSYGRKQWKKLFLAAGDGDFHEVVQHLVENENVSLILVGSMDSVSEELRPYASAVIEIAKKAQALPALSLQAREQYARPNSTVERTAARIRSHAAAHCERYTHGGQCST